MFTYGASWCFYGGNRSGIDQFLSFLSGEGEPPVGIALPDLPEKPKVISFAVQQAMYEEELRNDDTDFLDHPDPGALAAEFLPAASLDHPLIDRFRFREALARGFRQLSSGENRKLLLLQELLAGSRFLVVDCPFDGLDKASCHELDVALRTAADESMLLFLLVRNDGDIPPWCDFLGIFRDGKLAWRGPMAEGLPRLEAMTATLFGDLDTPEIGEVNPGEELIRLKNGFAGYEGKPLFAGLNLTITSGDHTLVTGANGCGKSTLLQIITGDHPKCYANDLTVFGKRRGGGESIWELKKDMGIVSPELHRSYRAPGTASRVILSGLYDSIGLYAKPTDRDLRQARKWLERIGLTAKAEQSFRRFSYGEQRLILIARALIKSPKLLVLDEPTQGLDQGERQALLDFLERLAQSGASTILYVSHREDEYRPFFRRHIRLEEYKVALI